MDFISINFNQFHDIVISFCCGVDSDHCFFGETAQDLPGASRESALNFRMQEATLSAKVEPKLQNAKADKKTLELTILN